MAAQLSFKGISHSDLLPHVPSGHLPRVHSILPGDALQSLRSSSQPPRVPGDLSRVCRAAARIAWFLFHLDCHRSAAALSTSLRCFSSVPNSCPDVGMIPASVPLPLGAGPVLLTLCPLLPSSYPVLHRSIYSFQVVRDSCPGLAGVLRDLPCLKTYS